MRRRTGTFPADDVQRLKACMLQRSNSCSMFVFMDSHGFPDRYGRYEWLMAESAASIYEGESIAAAEGASDWLFGHLCYEQKDAYSTKLSSAHPARIHFPHGRFFVPETVCYQLRGSSDVHIECLRDDPHVYYEHLLRQPLDRPANLPSLRFTPRTSRDRYLERVGQLRAHIAAGDCYEVNYCCEWHTQAEGLDAVAVYRALSEVNPAPFGTLYRCGDSWMIGASPERFFTCRDGIITAQPMKGTAPRGADAAQDEQLRLALRSSPKERAENVMIVDLLRNDLSRISVPGTVTVPELFSVRPFPNVHQMISDVQARLRPGVSLPEIMAAVFPSGSMTGAPKIKVMQLTERYEDARRELYSGSVGYFAPDGDMDFCVVIRSLFYNSKSGYLSYWTGSAITYDSDPRSEWEELRLKAVAMERIFE